MFFKFPILFCSVRCDCWQLWTHNHLEQFSSKFTLFMKSSNLCYMNMTNSQWGFLVSNIEWITFICNQKHGSQWKEGVKSASHVSAPIYVTKVMEKGNSRLTSWSEELDWVVNMVQVLKPPLGSLPFVVSMDYPSGGTPGTTTSLRMYFISCPQLHQW